MNLIQFYEQLNEANDIINNIKLPTDYKTKPKPTPKPSFYLPCNIMANIMSYLPTPLDHHKKKMKIVNEDFEIIKITEHRYNPRFNYIKWNLNPHNTSRSGTGLTTFWTECLRRHRFNEIRKVELENISPKLDTIINNLKTKKNILEFMLSKGIKIDGCIKREVKPVMIFQIKRHLRAVFKCPQIEVDSIRKPIEYFLYSL